MGQLVNFKTGGNVVSVGGGGGGGLGNIIGTDVRVSIWKPTPNIYIPSIFLKKTQPIHILDNTQGGAMVLLQRKLYFSKDPEGV